MRDIQCMFNQVKHLPLSRSISDVREKRPPIEYKNIPEYPVIYNTEEGLKIAAISEFAKTKELICWPAFMEKNPIEVNNLINKIKRSKDSFCCFFMYEENNLYTEKVGGFLATDPKVQQILANNLHTLVMLYRGPTRSPHQQIIGKKLHYNFTMEQSSSRFELPKGESLSSRFEIKNPNIVKYVGIKLENALNTRNSEIEIVEYEAVKDKINRLDEKVYVNFLTEKGAYTLPKYKIDDLLTYKPKNNPLILMKLHISNRIHAIRYKNLIEEKYPIAIEKWTPVDPKFNTDTDVKMTYKTGDGDNRSFRADKYAFILLMTAIKKCQSSIRIPRNPADFIEGADCRIRLSSGFSFCLNHENTREINLVIHNQNLVDIEVQRARGIPPRHLLQVKITPEHWTEFDSLTGTRVGCYKPEIVPIAC